MKIIGLLNFYSEDPVMLGAAVLSLAEVADHIVAVDGRYKSLGETDEGESTLPANSDPSGYAAIQGVCAEKNIGFTIHRPDQAWDGDEVAKRSHLFQLGDSIAEAGDWFLVWDSDQILEKFPDDLRQKLQDTEHDVAEVLFTEPRSAKADFLIRTFFRSGLGIYVDRAHYRYITEDGKLLWGNNATEDVEPCLDLTEEILVKHLTNFRSKERHDTQYAYYKRRDKLGVERGPCDQCKTAKSVRQVPFGFEKVTVGTETGLSASWTELCNDCFEKQKKLNDKVIRDAGFDPAHLGIIAVPEKDRLKAVGK